MKTCCVTGIREIPREKTEYVKQELRREIEQAIADGFTSFISSMLNSVDLDFATIVAEKMNENPDLLLEAVIPYSNRMKSKDTRFQKLIKQCSNVKIISQERNGDCYFARNHYLVENAQRVIAVSDGGQKDDTAQVIRMASAKRLELHVIQISEDAD